MKKIIAANINFISLCPRGKNRLKVLYKEDGNFEAEVRVKKSQKSGEVHAAIYVPNFLDLDDEFVDQHAVIKDMAYSHAKNGSKLDLRHNEKPLSNDQAFIAESFIIQKGDPRFADLVDDEGKKVDATGGWGAVIKLEDPVLQNLYDADKWQGVSLWGSAMVETVKSSEKRVLKSLLSAKESNSMDEEKFATLLKNALAPLVQIVEALKPAKETKKVEEVKKEKKPQAPIFDGDPLDLESVAAFQKKLKAFNLMQSVDWSNPAEVEKHMSSIQAKKEDDKEGDKKEKTISKEDALEVKRLKAEVVRLEKGSKQATDNESGGEGEKKVDEDTRLFQLGKAAGASINGKKLALQKKS